MREGVAIQDNLLFATVNTAIFQCDHTETFTFHFYREQIDFKMNDLLSFRKKINQINVIDLLCNECPDVEIINLPHCDRLIILPVVNVLELQEALEGAFAMLELNRLIHKEVIRKIV